MAQKATIYVTLKNKAFATGIAKALCELIRFSHYLRKAAK